MSVAGFKQIGMCDAGTLLTTPTSPLLLGIRQEASLDIEPHKTVKDHLEREFPNMTNFKFGGESLQTTIKVLKQLIDLVNLNADVQLQTTPQSSSANSEDVFQFAGNNKVGLGFEYTISSEKRSCKIAIEGAMEDDRAKTVVDSADSNTLANLGTTGVGAEFSNYRAPYFLAFEFPKATSIITTDDIIERKLTIKTDGKKDNYNRDIVDYLMVELELTGKNASIADLVTLFSKTLGASVLMKEKNGASTFDAFDFAPGVLTHVSSAKIDDKDRHRKVKFAGKIPIYDVSYDLDAANGGEADGDGSVGGTVKFGY